MEQEIEPTGRAASVARNEERIARNTQPVEQPDTAGTNTSGYDSNKAMSIALATPNAEDTGKINRSINDESGEKDERTNFFNDAYAEEERVAQDQINSINQYADKQLESLQPRQQERFDENRSVNVLSGLAGSSEANRTTEKVSSTNKREDDLVRAEAESRVQAVLGNISTKAVARASENRAQFSLDADMDEKTRTAEIEESVANAVLLSQSGVSSDALKTQDPEGYAYLAESMGGEAYLKATFTLNRPQESIIDKKLENGKYIIAYQNPIDGSTRVETLDLGLPPQYTKTIDAGNRILAIPDDWDGDPANLRTINKGLTPSQASQGTTPGSDPSGAYTSDLDAIVGATISTIGSKFGQETFRTQMARARNDADRISLVAAQVLKGAPAAVKTDFTNQTVGMRELDKAIALLDSGTKTGVLESGAQYLFNVAGQDYDPELAAINQSIIAAIQPYRNSVTGAAWGTQEDGEYQQLFGSTRYAPEELRQRLVGVKEILKSKSAQGLNSYVNPLGYYDNQFEVDGNFEPSNSLRNRVDQAGLDYDALLNDGHSEEEIENALTSWGSND